MFCQVVILCINMHKMIGGSAKKCCDFWNFVNLLKTRMNTPPKICIHGVAVNLASSFKNRKLRRCFLVIFALCGVVEVADFMFCG